MSQTRKPLKLDFEALPLVEAAARVTIAPVPLELSFKFLNEMHKKLGPEFPDLLEPDGFEQPPGLKTISVQTKILGAVFGGNPKGLRVAINPHLIAVRWLRQPLEAAPPYPRFTALCEQLWTVYEIVRELQPHVRPLVVNLVYHNIVRPADCDVLKEYFTGEVSVKAMSSGTPLELVLSWRESSGLDLRFELRKVELPKDQGEQKAYKLSTAAGGFAGEGSPRDLLGSLHDRLQFFFSDILSERAKSEWRLKEVQIG